MTALRSVSLRGHALRSMAAAALGLVASCGGVAIQPETVLPKALIEPIPARVGLVIGHEMQNYIHKETRNNADWAITLGPGNARLWRDTLRAEFRDVTEFADSASLAQAGLQGSFEPRIEQYSFATAQETGGAYYAVTIRYRVNLFAADGKLADSLTLTGYGNAAAKGLSSGHPLANASVAAMRDAAAKFLVQFPAQGVAVTLAKGGPVVADTAKSSTATNVVTPEIEAVPI
ncbi:MAG: hypothetical protein WCE48_09900, partial [Steroidobacteraceae bacterium]